jgi:hypothetical protein
MAHPKGSSVTLPRNRWPEALRDFLIGRSTVTVEDVAYAALRSPGGYHPDADAIVWARASLAGLKWRQTGRGAVWRRPAKA